MIKFTINLPPITKKNHSTIVKKGNRTFLIPSKQYLEYEKACKFFMPRIETIDVPVNVKVLYYMKTQRKVDLTNLESALLDVLVKYQVLKDDNSKIVVSTDGSRVFYDKENPRTEVEISFVGGNENGSL